LVRFNVVFNLPALSTCIGTFDVPFHPYRIEILFPAKTLIDDKTNINNIIKIKSSDSDH